MWSTFASHDVPGMPGDEEPARCGWLRMAYLAPREPSVSLFAPSPIPLRGPGREGGGETGSVSPCAPLIMIPSAPIWAISPEIPPLCPYLASPASLPHSQTRAAGCLGGQRRHPPAFSPHFKLVPPHICARYTGPAPTATPFVSSYAYQSRTGPYMRESSGYSARVFSYTSRQEMALCHLRGTLGGQTGSAYTLSHPPLTRQYHPCFHTLYS